MLSQLRSELLIEIEITGESSLLVKDGRFNDDELKKSWCGEGRDPVTMNCRSRLPSAVFVSHSDLSELRNVLMSATPPLDKLKYYLPGASIRGAWRSHLEKVLRSLDDDPRICDPLATGKEDERRSDRSCSTRLVNKTLPPPEHAYLDSCPVCKLLGSTAHASRLWFSDGAKTAGRAAVVDNVAISRQTGSVISPFSSVVLQDAKFKLEMRLHNFELWQVGLLGHLFDDLKAGRVALGSGKNKGFGRVTAKATSVAVTYYGQVRAAARLAGLRELMGEERADSYGLAVEEAVDVADICELGTGGAFWRSGFRVASPDLLWARVKPRFDQSRWEGFPVMAQRAARG